MEYDVFISHASEDKEGFVRDLAKRLEQQRIVVWYDEFTLKPGSSLRRSIDFGLAKCRYGIVVLSHNFFKKKWTNWELDGLVSRQNAMEDEMLIPIWLDISRDTILDYSPPLADKVAINSNIGIEEVVEKLVSVINPEGSTLVIARDYVYKTGWPAPVVTDDWWLDVVEYSGKEFLHHEYLSFPIFWRGWEPKYRGEYIGQHALQKMWQEVADAKRISQLTSPDRVLEFIEEQPGLKDAVVASPKKTAFYLPQLTIKGFGGFLESIFDEELKKKPKYNTKHDCDEEFAFRHPTFGGHGAIQLADIYFAGAGGGIGPPTSRYDHIDWILWLISDASTWLPMEIRSILLRGLKEWAVWQLDPSNSYSNYDPGVFGGHLTELMFDAKTSKSFKLTEKASEEIKARIVHTMDILNLPESSSELYQRFLEEKVIETSIDARKRWHARKKRS